AFVWQVDTIAPTARPPAASLIVGRPIGASDLPVLLAWSATDPAPSSGIVAYRLFESIDGGAYAQVSLPTPTTTSLTRVLSFAHSYRYALRAVDAAGNASNLAISNEIRPALA